MSKSKESIKRPTPASDKIKDRKCLMCLKQFLSEGPGNRICGECKKTPQYKLGNLNYHRILQ